MTNIISFTAPPLPHYIHGGLSAFAPGDRHLSRHNIGVFDLLVVRQGTMYVGEDDRQYEVTAGSALLLRPDAYHYGIEDCRERTEHFWIHFQTTGDWHYGDDSLQASKSMLPEEGVPRQIQAFSARKYELHLPQFTMLSQPGKMYETIDRLIALGETDYWSSSRWQIDIHFQQVLQLLAASIKKQASSPRAACAEQAAAYLRRHYREDVKLQQLGEELRFHPIYIARCMQAEFGCPPIEYLLRYRVEQAKLLLLRTDFTIARIAEEVGFHQAAYFTARFTRYEGISPRQYRQRFLGG
ncbi:AraC-like DNA-binding protein [Paenibacillus phyllosphaerae]|uniref:AraC-like DNA-binding protein n=1 Tax=Paenibacillus phyllosphaerae TaxID=274593 RepID=A0A7W5FRF2_9BACL|nr:AraC-like DNA-binding protein [Paenibacillus phyllosphaerae]